MPGIGELMDGAMQHAPQPGRHGIAPIVVAGRPIGGMQQVYWTPCSNRFRLAMGQLQERGSMVAKSAAFGVVHVVIAFGVSYALSGSLVIAGAITLVEPLVNTVVHYLFDRWWGHPALVAAWRRWTSPWRARFGHAT